MTEDRARRIDSLMDVVDAIHGETLAALHTMSQPAHVWVTPEDAEAFDAMHKAGAMAFKASEPYRRMHEVREDYCELSRRARLYQAQAYQLSERIAELEAEIERLKEASR
jgi:septal ring factor EnvC (AmiA/AmiB activator)